MNVNFDLIDNNALNFEGRYIDLHNNFEFIRVDYDIEQREVKLFWKKSNGDWVNKEEILSLVLVHKGVVFFKVIGQDEKSTFEDASCLGEITFFPSTARELNDSFLIQSKPNEGDDILYFFENGQVIRIHCGQIELTVKNQISNS